MKRVAALFSRLLQEEEGASASEYAVLVAVIAVAIAGAVSVFNMGGIFSMVRNTILNCMSGSC